MKNIIKTIIAAVAQNLLLKDFKKAKKILDREIEKAKSKGHVERYDEDGMGVCLARHQTGKYVWGVTPRTAISIERGREFQADNKFGGRMTSSVTTYQDW